MIKVIVKIYLYLINFTQAEGFYEYTITILWKQDSFKIADGSSFHSFTLNEGYFYDNQGSSGDVSSRGIRETGPKGNLINLNIFCQITEKNDDQFWARSHRKDTDLEGGAGQIKILSSTGKFTNLINAFCTYAVAFTKKSDMQKTKCKLADNN
tara:strand:- start:428 stop:886 length:459 start_codon:yes stop_codon:yes gene_type:complete